MQWRLLTVDDGASWDSVLRRCGLHDVYHLAAYHRVARDLEEGEPYLFVFEHDGKAAALPFVRRSLAGVEGVDSRRELYDATSVYGYPGIASSAEKDSGRAGEFAALFQAALRAALRELRVLALFSRSNPLVDSVWLFKGLADVRSAGTTIAIDLSMEDSEYSKQVSHGVRYNQKKAEKAGITVIEDVVLQKLPDFIEIYNQTMKRVGAGEAYLFPNSYYTSLTCNVGSKVRLFYALYGDKPIGAVIAFAHFPIIQYHLSGTKDGFQGLAPTATILEVIRRWGKDAGFSCFHLGGGVGGAQDSLYRFKCGFSKRRFDFHVASAILQRDEYVRVCNERQAWVEGRGGRLKVGNFFPAYRAPVETGVESGGSSSRSA